MNFRNALSRTLTITRAYLTVSPVAALDPGIADQNPSALGPIHRKSLHTTSPEAPTFLSLTSLGANGCHPMLGGLGSLSDCHGQNIISLFSALL